MSWSVDGLRSGVGGNRLGLVMLWNFGFSFRIFDAVK
jgi:hypothetical protein